LYTLNDPEVEEAGATDTVKLAYTYRQDDS